MAGMTRDDQILATVAAGMRDYDRIHEALEDSIQASFREGDRSHILIDIASAIEEASIPGISHAHWETVGTRLLHTLERYARAALTAKANDDLPQPDDEETDDE